MANIVELVVGENGIFSNSSDEEFSATVTVNGKSDADKTLRVAFIGWAQSVKNDSLYYEFFKEEKEENVEANAQYLKCRVNVPAWLARMPPTFTNDKIAIRYACRATLGEWSENDYVERLFDVVRELRLKTGDPFR